MRGFLRTGRDYLKYHETPIQPMIDYFKIILVSKQYQQFTPLQT